MIGMHELFIKFKNSYYYHLWFTKKLCFRLL